MQSTLVERVESFATEMPHELVLAVISPSGAMQKVTREEFAKAVRQQREMYKYERRPAGDLIVIPARSDIASVVKIIAAISAGFVALPVSSTGASPANPSLSEQDRLGLAPNSAGGYAIATGGTSGARKIITTPGMPTIDVERGASSLLLRTGWVSGQRQLLLGPLYHSGTLMRLIDGLMSGNSIFLIAGFRPSMVVRAVAEHSLEWVQLSPTHMRLLDPLIRRSPGSLSTLRGVLHTAAPCPTDTKQLWHRSLGSERVFEMYASTEGYGTTLCRGDEWDQRYGTVGKGFFTKIRIYGGSRQRLSPGQVGKVYMRSSASSVADRAGRATQVDEIDGYKSVGDMGSMDSDGFLFLKGRREDMINVGGENVYLDEVSDRLLSHSGIADVAVLSRPDRLLGSSVVALVELRKSGSHGVDDIRKYCVEVLPRYAIPSQIQFVDRVPRNEAGKLLRRAFEPGNEQLLSHPDFFTSA